MNFIEDFEGLAAPGDKLLQQDVMHSSQHMNTRDNYRYSSLSRSFLPRVLVTIILCVVSPYSAQTSNITPDSNKIGSLVEERKICYEIYRADVMKTWSIPCSSILMDKMFKIEQYPNSLKVATNSTMKKIEITLPQNRTMTLDQTWITEHQFEYSVFVYYDGEFNNYLTFQKADTKELIGLISFEESKNQDMHRTTIYIGADDILSASTNLYILTPVILLSAAAATSLVNFFHPIPYFASSFLPCTLISASYFQSHFRIDGINQLLGGSAAIILMSGVFALIVNVAKNQELNIIIMAIMVGFCSWGGGTGYIYIFGGGAIIFLFVCSLNLPEGSYDFTVTRYMRVRLIFFNFLLCMTILMYSELSWAVSPSDLYQRITRNDFSYNGMNYPEQWRAGGVGVLLICIIAGAAKYKLGGGEGNEEEFDYFAYPKDRPTATLVMESDAKESSDRHSNDISLDNPDNRFSLSEQKIRSTNSRRRR